jgi:uncharacterized membrane protein
VLKVEQQVVHLRQEPSRAWKVLSNLQQNSFSASEFYDVFRPYVAVVRSRTANRIFNDTGDRISAFAKEHQPKPTPMSDHAIAQQRLPAGRRCHRVMLADEAAYGGNALSTDNRHGILCPVKPNQ